jgi:hypothetical protein
LWRSRASAAYITNISGGRHEADRANKWNAQVETKKLEQLVRAGKLSPTSPADAELISKAQAILGASRETKLEVKAALQRQGFIA